MMAYSPLARSEIEPAPELLNIAHDVGCTPAQVMLRRGLQRGFIILPKSRNPGRMRENLAVSTLELSDAQMQVINGIDRNENVLTFRPGNFF